MKGETGSICAEEIEIKDRNRKTYGIIFLMKFKVY
jgi:hypothetical protein